MEGAKFYIAKYENGKWHFVNDITETHDGDKTLHKLEYSDGIEGEGLPDSDKKYIELSTTDKYELTGDSLKSGTLYKIIEVKAPSGYQGDDAELSGEGSLEALLKEYLANPEEFLKKSENSAYYNLVQRFVAVHYFKYNTTAKTDIPKPTNFSGNIMDVKSNGTISIPNNELIDIKATKTWVGTTGSSVTFELLWSTKKQSSGIPDDATAVTAEALGLIGNFNNERTIPGENGEKEATWNNLPNGLNDRPVYYYVRETSYTTSEGTFERQTDGTYKLKGGDKLGAYKPTYTGNGLNKNGTVSVTNSNGLVIQKTWLKSDKTSMNESEIPADKIKCNIYGKVSSNSSKELIEEDLILEKDHDWKYEPTGDKLSKYSQYDYIIIEETEVHLTKDSTEPDKWTSVDVALYGYVRSSTSNVTDGVGTATLINRDNTPTNVDVSVEKIWSDGNDGHEGIDVKLYKSNTAISDADLASTDISGLGLTEVTGITNTVTLNDSNNWKHTWNDLPFKGEEVSKYYYYAIETSVPTGYTASYFVNGNKTTITNSVPGSLTIDKKWLSKDGTDITSEIKNSADFKLYRRANSSAAADEDKKLDNLKIYAFGDSITAGEGLDNPTNERYSTLLQQMLSANGTNITVDNDSESGLQITNTEINNTWSIEGKIKTSKLDNSYGVVIVMAGTNNVLNTTDDIDYTMKRKMEGLLNTIYSKDTNSELVVFLEKIPRIIVEFESDRPGNRADTFSSLTLEQKQEKWNDLVTSYNNMLVQLADEYSKTYGKTIRVVDTYTAVGENFYRDTYAKIHPDKVGHQKIAELLYNEILSYYGIEGSKAPTDIKGLPSDFYKNGVVNTDLYEEVTDKAFTLPDESGNWSKTFTNLDTKKGTDDYVYYIVEESTGNWTAVYDGNGQIIGNEGATITVTNTIETIDLNVEKQWNDSQSHVGDTVQFKLHRTTDQSKIPAQHMMFEIVNEEYKDKTVEILQSGSVEITFSSGGLTVESCPPGFTAEIIGNKVKITANSGATGGTLVIKDSYGTKINIPLKVVEQITTTTTTITTTTTVSTTTTTTTTPESSDSNEPNLPKNYGNVSQHKPTIKAGYHVTKMILQVQDVGSDNLYVMLGDYSVNEWWNSNIRISKDNNFSFGGLSDYFKKEDVEKANQEDGTTIITIVPTGDKKIIDIQIGENGQYSFKYVITCQNDSGDIDYVVFPAESESSETENVRTFSPIAQISALSEEPQTGTWTSDTNGGEVYSTLYEMKDIDGWKATISNLPVKDSAGNAYYYWIEEVAVSGYEASYRYMDGDDTQNKAISSVHPGTDPKITITNTKKESSTTTMPSTGGNGAGKCYTIGGMLLLMSACGWAMHRRKRVIPH